VPAPTTLQLIAVCVDPFTVAEKFTVAPSAIGGFVPERPLAVTAIETAARAGLQLNKIARRTTTILFRKQAGNSLQDT
jgi:hypothetical protein